MLALLVTLTLLFTSDGLQITVQSDTATSLYIQIDPSAGATAEPRFRICTLGAGEMCGVTAEVGILPGLHLSPETVRVRAWDNTGDAPLADQTIEIPTPIPHRVYVPLL